MVTHMQQEYQKILQERLQEWRGTINNLVVSPGDVTVESRATLNREVKEMLQKKEVMKEKWQALQQATNEWALRKEHLEKASDELKAALDRVVAYFK